MASLSIYSSCLLYGETTGVTVTDFWEDNLVMSITVKMPHFMTHQIWRNIHTQICSTVFSRAEKKEVT